MSTNYQDVRGFMLAFGQECPDTPTLIDPEVAKLRLDLIAEELDELQEAMEDDDIVEIADAIADILYVTYGTALAYGIDADRCFAEVHRSNMSKLDEEGKPVYRADGKVLKGPHYSPPDLSFVLDGG